jgi:hypothetical protein
MFYGNTEYLLLFHGNNGYVKGPKCYVLRTLCLVTLKYDDVKNVREEA